MNGIVADAGPLIVLARSNLLGVLRNLAADVVVPATVFAECTQAMDRPGAALVLDAARDGLIEVRPDRDPRSLAIGAVNLGGGEIAALAWAHHLQCSVLMDDALGRKTAARHQIGVIGTAGILLAAKKRKLIGQVRPILAQWKEFGYFLAPALLESVLRRADEL